MLTLCGFAASNYYNKVKRIERPTSAYLTTVQDLPAWLAWASVMTR